VSLVADYYRNVSPPAIYVVGHGFTGTASQPRVRAVVARLLGRGAAVLALNFRGHGPSDGCSTVGVAEIDDLAAAVGWVQKTHSATPIVTVGFSMGASIVIRHAALAASGPDGRPSVAAAVAVSGPGRWYERGTQPMRRLHYGVETTVGRLALRWGFKTRVGGGWTLLPAAPVEVIGSVTVPLLVVHGDRDPYFGLEHPRMLAGAGSAAQPPVQLWIERGMGHAEAAIMPELVDRIDAWVRATLALEQPTDEKSERITG
ncbi:MAG: putative hydrolase, partial [Frankiales bacterium]|nr:putative hydrolase [Frankiales bacterium]